MTEITLRTTMEEALNCEELRPYAKYLMYSSKSTEGPATPESEAEQAASNALHKLPLALVNKAGWSPKGIVAGLNFFIQQLDKYAVEQYFVYNRIECDVLEKREVNVIRLKPEEIDPSKPSIILCAGGGYNVVCTMVESLPTARHFVEGGYQVFLLTYRAGTGDSVALNALDDLARAIKYLGVHKDILAVDPNNIVLCGFSAGANLICNYGVPSIGYKRYNLPKPKALFPIYTFIDLKAEFAKDPKGGGILRNMFGPNFVQFVLPFNIIDKIDGNFPPSYIVCGLNDTTVSPTNSEALSRLLDKACVPAMIEEANNAPHGFGDGTGTGAEGWPERAMEFLDLLGY